MHHLVCCIPYRVCCYSNSEPPINHSFYKKPQSSHSCHVPSYKPDRSWYVGGGFSNFFVFQLLSRYSCDIVKMNLSQELYVIIYFLLVWFPLTSLTNIAVISLDRMHATIRPFRHRLIKKRVYGVTIAGVWVLAAVLSTTMFILAEYEERSYHFYLWQSYCCLCLLVICVSYSSIVVKFLCGAHPQHHGAANRHHLKNPKQQLVIDCNLSCANTSK